MQKVTVSKESLVSKLKENRSIHEKEYKEMSAIYKEKMIVALEKDLEEYKNSNNINCNMHHIHRVYQAPKSFVKEYDLVIGMLEMSNENEFVITQNEYKQYVLNEWDWSNNSEMLKSTYLGGIE